MSEHLLSLEQQLCRLIDCLEEANMSDGQLIAKQLLGHVERLLVVFRPGNVRRYAPAAEEWSDDTRLRL